MLTNEEKARSVLSRTGSAGNAVVNYSAAEVTELAAIYDECCAPELLLAERIADFRGRRQLRLEAAKATVDEGGSDEARATS